MSSVTIYTKAWCGYCHAAKRLLQDKGLSFEEIPVDHDQIRFEEMVSKSQRRTVPQIFIDHQHIGGYTDLVRHFS